MRIYRNITSQKKILGIRLLCLSALPQMCSIDFTELINILYNQKNHH